MQEELLSLANKKRAEVSKWFFKAGPGGYGEGDEFVGLTMPQIRSVVKKHGNITWGEVERLVDSPIHELRMAGLLVMVNQFERSKDESTRHKLYDFYIAALGRGQINNWDLIDLTAPHIVGGFLADKQRDILYVLARSKSLWERRASMLATFYFINKQHQSTDALRIAEILMTDKHDLINKASGWMLREVGKRVNEKDLTDFLDMHAGKMPRTMLRYAIEKLTPAQKTKYMKQK